MATNSFDGALRLLGIGQIIDDDLCALTRIEPFHRTPDPRVAAGDQRTLAGAGALYAGFGSGAYSTPGFSSLCGGLAWAGAVQTHSRVARSGVVRSGHTGTRVARPGGMRLSTKLATLGAVGVAAYGASRALRKSRQPKDINSRFDSSDVRDASDVDDQTDISDPIIVTEEVVVITDAGPYAVDVDLIPADDRDER